MKGCGAQRLIFSVLLIAASGLELKCGKDHECGMLPDFSEPTVARHMKCGSCQLAVTQLTNMLIKKEAEAKKLTEEQATSLMEEFCDKDIAEYGLQLDENGSPLPKFTNDASLNRAQGGWVKRQLQSICGEVLSDFEEHILAASRRYCSTSTNEDGATVLNCDASPLVASICFDQLKLCKKEDKKAYLQGVQGQNSKGTIPEAKSTDRTSGADMSMEEQNQVAGAAPGSKTESQETSSNEAQSQEEEVVTLTLPGFKKQTSKAPSAQSASRAPEAPTKMVEKQSEGCSEEDWEQYGKLMDVDDLKNMSCDQFSMSTCKRCRSSEDCTDKASSCGPQQKKEQVQLMAKLAETQARHQAEMEELRKRHALEIQAIQKQIDSAGAK